MRHRLSFRRHHQTRYIRLATRQCKACWACIPACPHQVLGKVDFYIHRHIRIDQAEQCKGCLRCVKACPNQAIFAVKG